MHILIITPFYTPDIGPSAPLFSVLSNALVQSGNKITVITCIPHFATGISNPDFRKRIFYISSENNVDIIRVSVPSLDRSKLRNRLIQFIFFQCGATLCSFSKKYDVGLITNPAIETFFPFIYHAVFRKKPIIWSVFDVYPDVGIKLGIFRTPLIINTVKLLEQICLRHSTHIQIITNSFRSGLHALQVPENKIVLIPIWVDTDFIHPLPKNNSFSIEHQLEDKFVVLYAGNIGLSQGLENVLTVAEKLKDYDKLRFVFVGNGAGLQELQSQVQERRILNVQFIPFQPRDRLPEVLASADVSLVILKRGIGADSLPSKTFSALASGRPVLASVDVKSETWNLINQAEAGICVPPEDPVEIAEAIQKLMSDENYRQRLGKNGRIWAEKNHSVQSATEKFEELFIKAIKAGNS